jgi:hypothetical protein
MSRSTFLNSAFGVNRVSALPNEYQCDSGLALCLKIEIFRRSASPGNLPSQKVDRRANLRTQESNLFSVEERVEAKRVLISFVSVQDFPNRCTQDAIHFDSYESGLFQDSRVSILDEQKTSQDTVSVKAKILKDKEPLFRQAAAAQGPVYCQKR